MMFETASLAESCDLDENATQECCSGWGSLSSEPTAARLPRGADSSDSTGVTFVTFAPCHVALSFPASGEEVR